MERLIPTRLPSSVVLTDAAGRNYVYVVRSRKGLFGDEYYLERNEVTVRDRNDVYVVVGGRNLSGNDNIVVTVNTILISDIVVKLFENTE